MIVHASKQVMDEYKPVLDESKLVWDEFKLVLDETNTGAGYIRTSELVG
jgi:hypothetical protein